MLNRWAKFLWKYSLRSRTSIHSRERDWTYGDGQFCVHLCTETISKRGTSVAHLTNFSFNFFPQKLPLYHVYTIVQIIVKNDQKLKSKGPALKSRLFVKKVPTSRRQSNYSCTMKTKVVSFDTFWTGFEKTSLHQLTHGKRFWVGDPAQTPSPSSTTVNSDHLLPRTAFSCTDSQVYTECLLRIATTCLQKTTFIYTNGLSFWRGFTVHILIDDRAQFWDLVLTKQEISCFTKIIHMRFQNFSEFPALYTALNL